MRVDVPLGNWGGKKKICRSSAARQELASPANLFPTGAALFADINRLVARESLRAFDRLSARRSSWVKFPAPEQHGLARNDGLQICSCNSAKNVQLNVAPRRTQGMKRGQLSVERKVGLSNLRNEVLTAQYMNSTGTSYGQSLLKQYLELFLPSFPFQENFRPSWLFGMELDFFNDSLRLALEFQGDQHYAPTGLFGDCTDQQRRDQRKRELCVQRKILIQSVLPSDLNVSKMRNLAKRAIRFGSNYRKENGLPDLLWRVGNPPNLALNFLRAKCGEYRRNLIEHYGSCVAFRKGRKRDEAQKRLIEKWNTSNNFARFGH